MFPYISICKTCDPPPGWTYFWRQGHNLNKLGRGPLVSDKKIFFMLSLYKPMQNMFVCLF